jgi:DNA-binding FadR family transcriptional regulator
MTDITFDRADRLSLSDAAAQTLREALAEKRWAVGERIPVEAKLAEALGVSKGTLREAIRVLASQGLLEVRQGSGTYVLKHFDPSASVVRMKHASWRDQFEVRCALEVEAARLAALRHTPEDIEHLNALLDERGDFTQCTPEFVERDLRFHRAVVDAARNKALSETYRLLSSYVEETIAASQSIDAYEPDLQMHRQIVRDIATGDPELAGRSARALIDAALSHLTT